MFVLSYDTAGWLDAVSVSFMMDGIGLLLLLVSSRCIMMMVHDTPLAKA